MSNDNKQVASGNAAQVQQSVQAGAKLNEQQAPTVLDTFAAGRDFSAQITHSSGAKVYKTSGNELFCVVVLSTDIYNRALLLVDESKENGSPITFESAVEKCLEDGVKANLRSVEYTLNNKRRKAYEEGIGRLTLMFLTEPGSKTWNPEEFAKQESILKRKLRMGSTRVELS